MTTQIANQTNSNGTTTAAETAKPTYVMNLRYMMERVEKEPKQSFIYSGIKEKSVGIVFGASKSGKTMYCENLAMAIAAGMPSFLGLNINIQNRKVLIISFEEYYTNRTDRNAKQAAKICQTNGTDWLSNYLVITENVPIYISTDDHWKLLKEMIMEHQPGVVIFDSFSRMVSGIEDSTVAQSFMQRFKGLAKETDTTFIAIHHTHKMYGKPIDMDCIAGSRIIAQELDFMIGINRGPGGKRYVKEVAFRYAEDKADLVREFTIDSNCWLNLVGEVEEYKLLAEPGRVDGRVDDTNRDKIFDFLVEQKDKGVNAVQFGEIKNAFVETGQMAKQTTVNALKKLVEEGVVEKDSRGIYKLAQAA